MRKQGASTQVSGFSKAQSTNEKPTPETSHNDSKICGGAVVALHTFGGRSYLGGNDYPPNVCNQSHCSPKAESPRKDYQSDTSNALSTILGLQGRVLIGDRALQYRFSGGKAIDMGQVWWEKHRLPFVFGRLCYNKHAHFYSNIARAFVKKRAKIPHYILQARAKACGIPSAYIREYLTHIHYHIQAKERAGLERFYRALRLQAIKPPSRIYPRNVDSSKCAPNAPYKGSSNV
nr:MqnA/MqnD/SBP family protein [Helicobacter canis]